MNTIERQFLLNTFPEFKGRTMKGEVLQKYYEAERILNGYKAIKKRSCGCHYAGMGREVDKKYETWLQNNK